MAIETLYPAISPSLDLNFARSKTLDPRITFSRASAATYYDGKTVAKAEENLFTYSQDFDNAAWIKSSATVTANSVAAPDGTFTADKLVETAANSEHRMLRTLQLSSGTANIVSIHLKASEKYMAVLECHATQAFAVINLSTGVITSSGAGGANFGGISYSIVNAGSGWYRVTLSFTALTALNVNLSVYIDSVTPYTGDGSSGIYIWGVQLEQGSQVTAYTPTTTQPITNYIPVLQTAPAGVPRIDHNPVTGESLGLLIEEQRTNVRTWSQQFDNAAWSKNNLTVAANTIIAPDGTFTGDKLIENAVNGTHTVSGTISAAGTCTLSVYLKAAERTRTNLNIYDPGTGTSYGASFDLYSGVVVTNSAGNTATITPVGNGWFRCSISRAILSSGGPFTIFVSDAAGGSSYQGDGYSGIYIWGAQLESGSFPTSYIKTEASQVTRAADSAQMTGANFSSWYRQDEGTIYHEAMTLFVSGGGYSLTDGTMSNRIAANTDSTYHIYVQSSGQAQASIAAGNIPVRTLGKVAGAYKANDFAASVNGGSSVTDTVGSIPQRINKLGIGMSASGISDLNGWMKRLTYYPKRLSNLELQALTA